MRYHSITFKRWYTDYDRDIREETLIRTYWTLVGGLKPRGKLYPPKKLNHNAFLAGLSIVGGAENAGPNNAGPDNGGTNRTG